jgi:ribonuclease HI
MISSSIPITKVKPILLQFDGGSSGNPGPSGFGSLLFLSNENIEVYGGSSYMTNNEAEYNGLLLGLQKAIDLGIKQIHIQGDSSLVINQLSKKWKINAINLKPLFEQCQTLLSQFEYIELQHIPRSKNSLADSLTWKQRPT